MSAKRISARGAASKVMEGTTLVSILGPSAVDGQAAAEIQPVEPQEPPAPDLAEQLAQLQQRLQILEEELRQAWETARQAEAKAQEWKARAVAAEEELRKALAEKPETPPEPRIDVGAFLEQLKTAVPTRSGTSHYVAESIDAWLEETKAEFRIFGRAKGPNEAGAIWNMGVLLLKLGLDTIPDWRDRIRKLAHSPDLALVEMFKLAIMGVRSKLT